MIYLLDTNTCITYLKVPTSPIRTRLAGLQPGDVVVCILHNTREFGRVTGLKLEDWEAKP
jgi:predicted nucleic acid-binding protein